MNASSPGTSVGVRALLAGARRGAHARLEQATGFPITVVSAPAGYGRTTVVRDFLATSGIAHRSIDVDVSDGDVLAIVRAIAHAVRDIAPALASTFVSVCDRLGGSTDGAQQIANWIGQYIDSVPLTFVINGTGSISDGRVSALLAALIDRTREPLRWILVLESAAGLPVARWLAEGRMDFPVDECALQITESDLIDAGERIALPMSGERLSKLLRLTGPWPAAIALGLAAGNRLDLDTSLPIGTALYSYLAEAAFSTLSARAAAFIERTCLFDTFDAALLECAGLLDFTDILDRLTDDIGVLDFNSAGSYRYDELFAQFVCARLQSRGDWALRSVAAACADACLRDGRLAEPIAIYAKLGDWAALGGLVSAHGFALIERGDSDSVQRALNRIPHDVLADFPGALAVKANLESLHGKFDVAEAWFRHALDRISDESQRAEIVYRFAIDLVRRERSDAIDLLLPVIAGLNEEMVFAAPLMGLLATAYVRDRKMSQAALAIDRALHLLPRVTDRVMRAKVLHQAAFVALHLANIPAAKVRSLEAFEEASATYNFDLAARALSVLYNIAIDYEDDIAAGRACLEKLAGLSSLAGSRQLLLYATLCLYELEVLGGNVRQVAQLNDQLKELEVFFSVLTTETLLPAQALQATWDGDFYRAFRLVQWSGEHQINLDRRAYRYGEIAVYAAAAGLRDEASSAAERALTFARRSPVVNKTVLQALAYVALTFVLLRRPARAAKLLGDLAPKCSGNQCVALLVRVVGQLAARWNGEAVADELGAALADLDRQGWGGLASMVEALPLPETTRSRFAQLTWNDRDILKRLAGELRPQDVAAGSGRSVHRFHANVQSICRKLGCSDWRHAVALAVAEGFLHDEEVDVDDVSVRCIGASH